MTGLLLLGLLCLMVASAIVGYVWVKAVHDEEEEETVSFSKLMDEVNGR